MTTAIILPSHVAIFGKGIQFGEYLSAMKSVPQFFEVSQDRKEQFCPLLYAPLKDCYVKDMNSGKIAMAVYYCQNNFEMCEIYKKNYKK